MLHVSKHAPVVVVPSYHVQVSRCVMFQQHICSTVHNPKFACSMCGYQDHGQKAIWVWVEIVGDMSNSSSSGVVYELFSQ